MTATPSSSGLAMARQLLARETAGAVEPPAITAAIQRALARVSENLRHSVGDDGYNALVSRAIARTQTAHPVVIELRRGDDADFSANGVRASIDAHGAPAVTEAVESLLASIADVLSGLIGADMVLNLLDPDGSLPDAPQRRHVR